MKNILIGGCGDLGNRVGERFVARGAKVVGIARSQGPCSAIEWCLADLDRAEALPDWPCADGIYYFAPPPGRGVEDPRLSRFLSAIREPPIRFVLVSTTGVYGDRGGAWVNEESGVSPSTERACRRVHAEQTATAWCAEREVQLVILRVAGIYGPGRWPLDRLRAGMVVLESSSAPYSNRIHIEDLTRIAVEAMERPGMKGVYNVSDGKPGSLTEYFFEIADAFGLTMPREVSLAEAREVMSEGMLSYLSESRRISNRKLLRDSGLELRYPDLRSALARVERGGTG